MTYKYRDACKNNLYQIRKTAKLSQQEMGEILGVGERMICNYETFQTDLPIDKALILSQKFTCSLDYIYCRDDADSSFRYPSNDILIDIKDFISIHNNNIIFSIPDIYWSYLEEINDIQSSHRTEKEKLLLINELNIDYTNKQKDNSDTLTNKSWNFSVPINQFGSYIKVDSSYIPFLDKDSTKDNLPTDEDVNNAHMFLKEIT